MLKQLIYFGSIQVGGNYTSNNVGLQNPSCNEYCPTRCANTWEFFDDPDWKLDSTIRLECADIVTKGT